MIRKSTLFLSAALGVSLGAALALPSQSLAQDSSALVDALVRKGVLSSQEADDIRTEMSKEAATSSASKLKLSDSVKELKLYGDTRLRYQYDSKDFQVDNGSGRGDRSPSGTQQSRWRFRLRLNADFKLSENVFGGVELQTAIQSDSANQTFENGFSDYPIFISKAFLGWAPTEWLTLAGGKLPNPFYTTDLIWDSDINPAGITQQIAFHKINAGAGDVGGYSKDGKKSVVPTNEERPWELTLVAGQLIFDDNLEGGGRDPGDTDNDSTTDSYLFQTQLVGSYKFSKNFKATIAPGWMIYNAASAEDVQNSNSFDDNDFVSGSQRNLNILLLPGDLAFKVAGIKTKLYWDLAYNLEGRKRVENTYSYEELAFDDDDRSSSKERIRHEDQDSLAWLAGVQLGENKKGGDWSLLANYRETGLGAIDPNLNDGDVAQGELNTRAVKFGLAYNLTDFAVFTVTYAKAWQLRDISGGEATRGNAIADSNAVDLLQVDLNVKF